MKVLIIVGGVLGAFGVAMLVGFGVAALFSNAKSTVKYRDILDKLRPSVDSSKHGKVQ